MSKTVAAEEFEAHPGELLREAREKQEELVVMEDGKPLATVIPAKWPVDISALEPPAGRRNRTLEELRGSAKTIGDIVEPLEDERPRKTLEQMRAEGVKILGDIVEPMEKWDMTK
jgi:prevent-host-death family protein